MSQHILSESSTVPIYAYKCTACGHAQDVLQKISDKPLTECPECKQSTYAKQVTAAGFQLKGSGWYVTDFRNHAGGTSKTSEAAVGKTATDCAAGGASESGSSTAAASTPSADAAAPVSSSTSTGA
jgi:putative FmdB family regulatory protein